MLRLDHIVVVAENLAEGTEYVADTLGVPLQKGGEHAFMGTHNTLLSLGPEVYLEVIAVDPMAPAPERPRWFGMDDFAGAPRLTNWVCSSDDMLADHALTPPGMEHIIDAQRGDLRWKMAVPTQGQYPFEGAYPGLIAWQTNTHPCQMLPDQRVRLAELTIEHPKAPALRNALAGLGPATPVCIADGPVAHLSARFATPKGEVLL